MGKIDPTGYPVFVRTVSAMIVAACLLTASGIYFFRVGILQTYAQDVDNSQDLILILCLLAIAVFFTGSICCGKFLWFVGK